jgi:hypothetical protein
MSSIGVRELAELFFGSRSIGGIIVMIRAAFDASMDHPCGITAVAGYIGSSDDWFEVEYKWNTRLAMLDMQRYRHTDVFRRYHYDEAIKVSLGFADILRKSKLRSIAASMLDTDWNLLEKDSEYLELYPQRQHACLDRLLGVLAEDVNLEYKDSPVALVFDNDYGNIEMASRVYEAWRKRTGHPGFFGISFIKSEQDWDVVPLQCGDLLAGAIRRDPYSREKLEKLFSDKSPFSKDMSVSTIRTWAMANGRSTQWSVAIAHEIEALKKRFASEGE